MLDFGWVRERGRLGQVGLVAVALLVTVGVAVAVGIVGTPSVGAAENRFTDVSTNTTTVDTTLTVSNPNPVGVSLGGTTIDYTVSMNDVPIASGEKTGLSLDRGNTTLEFSTRMDNEQIPAWWVSHIRNGERTQVSIDATVSDSLVGDRSYTLTQERTVETDIMGSFNSTETRPVNGSQPLISDPVLYINETRGSWDRDNVSQSSTPTDIEFDVYNPKPTPYVITRVGYRTTMNGVEVGTGETDRSYIIPPGERRTVDIRTTIRNERLDQWWVSHLRRNQNTTMVIDFYLIVEGAGERFRVDVDTLDYETQIETDIFGNKAQYPTGEPNATAPGRDTDGGATGETGASDGTPTDDGGILGGV